MSPPCSYTGEYHGRCATLRLVGLLQGTPDSDIEKAHKGMPQPKPCSKEASPENLYNALCQQHKQPDQKIGQFQQQTTPHHIEQQSVAHSLPQQVNYT